MKGTPGWYVAALHTRSLHSPVPLMVGRFSLENLAQLPQQSFLTDQCSQLFALRLFSSATLIITTACTAFNF